MYTITKTFTVDMAHRLVADYDTPCLRLHGHTYTINLHLMRICKGLGDNGNCLDANGMVIDFKKLKEIFDVAIKKDFDHMTVLSSKDSCTTDMFVKFPGEITVIEENPTAENFARIFYMRINAELQELNTGVTCFKVDVFETAGNMATFSL